MKMIYKEGIWRLNNKKTDYGVNVRIRQLREKHNMSQEVLAQKLHIKRQTISSYERGKSIPDIYMLIKIADIFEVSLDELVGRK